MFTIIKSALAKIPSEQPNPSSSTPLGDNVSNLNKALSSVNGNPTLGQVMGNIYSLAIIFAALIVFVYLIWGGFEWLTAGGDSDKISKAQKKLTGAVIGFTVVLAAWALWRLTLNIGGLGSFFPLEKK